MADITIAPRLPVINGFVAIPNGENLHRTSLTPDDVLSLIPGCTLLRMGRGTNLNGTYDVQSYAATSRQQDQLWIVLPEYEPDAGFPSDWYNTLLTAAAS